MGGMKNMLNQIVLVGRLVQDPKSIIEIVAEKVTFLSSRKETEEE